MERSEEYRSEVDKMGYSLGMASFFQASASLCVKKKAVAGSKCQVDRSLVNSI